MNKLSPQAQAVLDAVRDNYEPYWDMQDLIAAALRAVADRMVPNEPHPGESQFWDDEANKEWQSNQHFRQQLLAIADELEGGIG